MYSFHINLCSFLTVEATAIGSNQIYYSYSRYSNQLVIWDTNNLQNLQGSL